MSSNLQGLLSLKDKKDMDASFKKWFETNSQETTMDTMVRTIGKWYVVV